MKWLTRFAIWFVPKYFTLQGWGMSLVGRKLVGRKFLPPVNGNPQQMLLPPFF